MRPTAAQPLLNTTPLKLTDVVGRDGHIDNVKLRQYVTQETKIKSDDKFLTDYVAAIAFEVECVEGVDVATLANALKILLQKNASLENIQHFEFVERPDPNNPFSLSRSLLENSCLMAGHCLSLSAASLCAAGMAFPPLLALYVLAFIVLMPVIPVAYTGSILARTTNRENIPVSALHWLITIGASGGATYALYHNVFPKLYAAILNKLNHEDMFTPAPTDGFVTPSPSNVSSARVALGLCHYLCFFFACIIFSMSAAAASRVDLSRRAPSRKWEDLIRRMKNVEPTDQEKTVLVALDKTNFANFLLEAKKKGSQYYQAAKIIIDANIERLSNTLNSRPEHTAVSVNHS